MHRKDVGERGGKTEFSLNTRKDGHLKEAIQAYAKRHLPDGAVYIRPHWQTPECEMVIISHRTFARFCAAHVGVGSAAKRLSRSLMASSPSIQRAFLSGYFSGDGSVSGRKDGSRVASLSACTASQQLANQIFWLLDRIGVVATLSTGKNNGGPANRAGIKTKWTIWVRPRECTKMESVLGHAFHPRDNRSGMRVASAACTYGRVRSVGVTSYAGAVYNLHVAGDESYIANLCTVHNCFYLKCQAKDRGYVERIEQRIGGDDTASPIQIEQLVDVASLPHALQVSLLEHFRLLEDQPRPVNGLKELPAPITDLDEEDRHETGEPAAPDHQGPDADRPGK
jgi:hypothetical protein